MLNRGVLSRVVLWRVVRCCVKLCPIGLSWVTLGFSWAKIGDVVFVCAESC